MTIYTVPLINTPQTFSIILGSNTYTLTNKYNEFQGWLIDIADVNNIPILSNIPLTTGRNLLEPFAYMNFGGGLWVSTDGSDSVPTLDNLGIDSNLYFTVQ